MNIQRFLSITSFEFRRHLDVRGELMGLLLLIGIAIVKLGGDYIVAREASIPISIVATDTPLAGRNEGRFHFTRTPVPLETDAQPVLKEADNGYSLHVSQWPSWIDELQSSLDVLEREHALAGLGISAQQRRAAERPPSLQVIGNDGTLLTPRSPLAAIAIALVVLTTLSILGCLGMIFNGLLDERFGHATEMILTASPAGFWLDCKVASSILHGLKTLGVYGSYSAAGWALINGVSGEIALLPDGFASMLPGALAFCVLGLLLWNWFFAACATAIQSPHSAFRNSLAAFPLTMIIMGFGAIRAPDGLFMQVLSFFPFTSMAAMPVRMLYVDVAVWETTVSLLLLGIMAMLLRSRARMKFRNAVVSPVEKSTIPK